MAARFELKKSKNGQFTFNLKAGNGETIFGKAPPGDIGAAEPCLVTGMRLGGEQPVAPAFGGRRRGIGHLARVLGSSSRYRRSDSMLMVMNTEPMTMVPPSTAFMSAFCRELVM